MPAGNLCARLHVVAGVPTRALLGGEELLLRRPCHALARRRLMCVAARRAVDDSLISCGSAPSLRPPACNLDVRVEEGNVRSSMQFRPAGHSSGSTGRWLAEEVRKVPFCAAPRFQAGCFVPVGLVCGRRSPWWSGHANTVRVHSKLALAGCVEIPRQPLACAMREGGLRRLPLVEAPSPHGGVVILFLEPPRCAQDLGGEVLHLALTSIHLCPRLEKLLPPAADVLRPLVGPMQARRRIPEFAWDVIGVPVRADNSKWLRSVAHLH
mmetsp:Transcript_8897/g.27606  ORF Transcript_8897/g.27606 Transcript_8897/m.27606 type:complete len:267 (+) Transcript_8897:411-1211(+)